MQLRSVREGDTVQCNVRGRVFDALVEEKLPGREGVRVTPLAKNISYFKVKSNQIRRIVEKGPRRASDR
jgi:hypothetical protein